ncbi:MAG: ribosome maturation factor RimM [Gammaproteobacteria bacterium]|nr:ribosome maturation factor RimM [Gammaproteobacteria bacterium]
MSARQEHVPVGYISGLHGVQGWLKVYSYTDPVENIFEYRPWLLAHQSEHRVTDLVDAKRHGSGLIVKLEGIDDRDQAATLVGAQILVAREQLPPTDEGEYYWADLVGLQVVTDDGRELGTVERLFETGANDVMVVRGERERLIPWILGDVIDQVDLDSGCIRVRWDPEY